MRTSTTAKKGDLLALKHGAYRPVEAFAPRTEEILEQLHVDAPYLKPADMFGLTATALVISRFEEMSDYFEAVDPRTGRKRGAIDSRGRPRAALKLYVQLYDKIIRGLGMHGLTLQGRAVAAPGLIQAQKQEEAMAIQAQLRAKYGDPRPPKRVRAAR
jgi:hypothetical protein